jgi:hypothetical protein
MTIFNSRRRWGEAAFFHIHGGFILLRIKVYALILPGQPGAGSVKNPYRTACQPPGTQHPAPRNRQLDLNNLITSQPGCQQFACFPERFISLQGGRARRPEAEMESPTVYIFSYRE